MRRHAYVQAMLTGGIAAASILFGSSVPGLAQQQPAKPAPADIQQHKTTPGGQYQPSLDTLGGTCRRAYPGSADTGRPV